MIRILNCNEVEHSAILERAPFDNSAEQVVRGIIADVRDKGDEALFRYAEQFDNATLKQLEVSEWDIDIGFRRADPMLVEILFQAAERITAFHQKQVRNGYLINEEKGVLLGQKVLPLERVGLYVPGGTAAYPSSVLMNCLPAKIAGVKEIIMVTPPTGGQIHPNILAAAKIAGVSRVFQIGGAQAIAALAYGTESVPRVDKIVGPGNQYVAEAKKQVFGVVDIDMIAGPSEILILADGSCNPRFVAADLLSQAEHDKNASAVLVTDSLRLAEAVAVELEVQLAELPRKEIAAASIERNGRLIVVDHFTDGIDLANELAPEHLELCVDNPFDYLDRIRNAGSVFLGKHCPEALGDYYAGPNHTLPTGGTARFFSPLSVDDFVKTMQYSYVTPAALDRMAQSVAHFARQEGLHAHAKSVTIRTEDAAL